MRENNTVDQVEVEICFVCKQVTPKELLSKRVAYNGRGEYVCDPCRDRMDTAIAKKKRLREG